MRTVLATAFWLLAFSSSLLAQSLQVLTPGTPRTEKEVLKLFPEAVKLRDGVIQVERNGNGRLYLFGAAGQKYRLDMMAQLRDRAVKTPGFDPVLLKRMDQTVAMAQRALRAREAWDRRQQQPRSITKSPIEFYDEGICDHYVDVHVQYYDGWTNAAANSYINAEPTGFGPAWEGVFMIGAFAYKYTDTQVLDYDEESMDAGSGSFVDADVQDSWGAPQTCTLMASAVVEATGNPNCYPEPWVDYGSCL
jgi:hypothetical protein